MANHLGGRVVFSGRREYGAGVLHIKNGSELLGGLGKQLDVWNSHGDGSNSDVRHGDGAVWKDSTRFAFCGTASTANLDEVEISPVDLR